MPKLTVRGQILTLLRKQNSLHDEIVELVKQLPTKTRKEPEKTKQVMGVTSIASQTGYLAGSNTRRKGEPPSKVHKDMFLNVYSTKTPHWKSYRITRIQNRGKQLRVSPLQNRNNRVTSSEWIWQPEHQIYWDKNSKRELESELDVTYGGWGIVQPFAILAAKTKKKQTRKR